MLKPRSGLKFSVSTTSVSPSQRPRPSPSHCGIRDERWSRPSSGTMRASMDHLREDHDVVGIADLAATHPEALSPAEHDRLLALGADLETAWTHPSATAQTRKRIVRAVLEEIVVKLAADQIELLLHWRGGDHTSLTRIGLNRSAVDGGSTRRH